MKEATERQLEEWRLYLNEIKQWRVVKEYLEQYYPGAVFLQISQESEYDDEGSYSLSLGWPVIRGKNRLMSCYSDYDMELTEEEAENLILSNGWQKDYANSYSRDPFEYLREKESIRRSEIFPGTMGEFETYEFNLNNPPQKPNFTLYVE